MVLPWHFLADPIVQLFLSLPVYAMGLWYFGRSAYHSLKTGVPNMDVLIFIGAASALFYSVFGTWYYWNSHEVHNYLFYETGATIITLVLFGNVLEKRSVKKTTLAIQSLNALQVKTARLIVNHDGHTHIQDIEVQLLKKGDIIQVNEGDLIPIDGIIHQGNGECNESMLSGESMPVQKTPGEKVFGGTLLQAGNMQVQVSSGIKDTVLSQIIEMVKKAQGSKPQIQKLGDRVSAVFVPAVVLISLITFCVSYFILDLGSAQSMLRAVAVLVISCPCAMGLATPTAIMVGIGKAAKRGILIKGGDVLENFAKTEEIIFDKTGTLSTGHFIFNQFWFEPNREAELKARIFALENHSSHPIAKALVAQHANWHNPTYTFSQVKEEKGKGIMAYDEAGNQWRFGSANFVETHDKTADLYLSCKGQLMARMNISDELKPGANNLIEYLQGQNLNTVLLSGDREVKVKNMALQLGIDTYYAEKLPVEKLEVIEARPNLMHVAMVGDGVNDAPALSKVNVGISFAKGSEIAIQAANLVLMRKDLACLQEAHIISKQTYRTIKQNLFWAFFYNIICIPLAAAGYMHPMLGALSMAFSDVIVIGNSLLLGIKKVKAVTPSEVPLSQ